MAIWPNNSSSSSTDNIELATAHYRAQTCMERPRRNGNIQQPHNDDDDDDDSSGSSSGDILL